MRPWRPALGRDMSGASESTPAHPLSGVDSDERYALRDPLQVRRTLQVLSDRRTLISAYLAGREPSFPTAILGMADDADWLLLDGNVRDAVNHRLQQAPHLHCIAQIERVDVRFRLYGHTLIQHQGRAAFRVPLPDSVIYRQRREFYRLETPVGESPWCVIRARADDGETAAFEFRIADISCGGLALMSADHDALFRLAQCHAHCELHLPGLPPVAVALEVRSIVRQTLANGAEALRIGMRFAIPLRSGAEAAIQRYILRIERERIARRNGLL